MPRSAYLSESSITVGSVTCQKCSRLFFSNGLRVVVQLNTKCTVFELLPLGSKLASSRSITKAPPRGNDFSRFDSSSFLALVI